MNINGKALSLLILLTFSLHSMNYFRWSLPDSGYGQGASFPLNQYGKQTFALYYCQTIRKKNGRHGCYRDCEGINSAISFRNKIWLYSYLEIEQGKKEREWFSIEFAKISLANRKD